MAALTLRHCLEQVAQLGTDYVVTDQQTVWTAVGLLASLARSSPEHLDLPMYLRFPDARQDGAICQVTLSGYILRYHFCRRLSSPD